MKFQIQDKKIPFTNKKKNTKDKKMRFGTSHKLRDSQPAHIRHHQQQLPEKEEEEQQRQQKQYDNKYARKMREANQQHK